MTTGWTTLIGLMSKRIHSRRPTKPNRHWCFICPQAHIPPSRVELMAERALAWWKSIRSIASRYRDGGSFLLSCLAQSYTRERYRISRPLNAGAVTGAHWHGQLGLVSPAEPVDGFLVLDHGLWKFKLVR